jgi:pSer/pThr/pTyr-binding forkhead associated (FHA) protein
VSGRINWVVRMRGDFELRYTGTCQDASPSQVPLLIPLSGCRLPVTLGRQAGKGAVVATGPDGWSATGTKVSRKHVAIGRRADGTLAAIDRGSTNGTYINGTRITQGEEHQLRYGDTLAIAGTDGVLQWQLLRAESPAAKRPAARANPKATAGVHGLARKPVPPAQQKRLPADAVTERSGRFTLARAALVEAGSTPAWQNQSRVLKSVSKLDEECPSPIEDAVGANAVRAANARQQLSGTAGVVIEGLRVPEFNSVYLPSGDHR